MSVLVLLRDHRDRVQCIWYGLGVSILGRYESMTGSHNNYRYFSIYLVVEM